MDVMSSCHTLPTPCGHPLPCLRDELYALRLETQINPSLLQLIFHSDTEAANTVVASLPSVTLDGHQGCQAPCSLDSLILHVS